jgi:ribulose-phosphate 3-epimerase
MPEEDISIIGEFIEEADFVQQMGIENIGHQGEEMSERVLSNISTLRSMYPQLIISVDGGVNLETAERLISLGVDRLVSGSYILNSENPKNSFDSLSSL